MSVSVIQEASRVIRDYEQYPEAQSKAAAASREYRAINALRKLRAESLEMMSALAACMMDEEIGERARELSQGVRDAKVPEAFKRAEQ